MPGTSRGWPEMPPSTVYERWVRGLRSWATDPSVRLEDLPPLSEDTYDPATYARLVSHLEKAVNRLMEDWQDLLSRALARATDEHELGRELVNLRAPLARRAALSRLPNLPEQMRSALRNDTERAISDIQTQLEEALADPGRGARIDRTAADRLVAVARATPLTDALNVVDPSERPQVAPTVASPGNHSLPTPLAAPGPGSPLIARRPRWSHRVVNRPTPEPDGGPHA